MIFGFILGVLVVVIAVILISKYVKIIKHTDLLLGGVEDYGKDDDYTTLVQSKALLDLEILEKAPLLNPSAFYVYYAWVYNTTPIYAHVTTPSIAFKEAGDDYVPCWSNERLISLISSVCDNVKIEKEHNYYTIRIKIGRRLYYTEKQLNLTDSLFDVVSYLLSADIIKGNIEEED